MEKKEKNRKVVKEKRSLKVRSFKKWLRIRRRRPSIEVITFDFEKSPDKQYSINLNVLVSNNTKKTISISEKYLYLYDRTMEVEKICLVESKQKRKGKQESPDDTITLKPGESMNVYIEKYVIEQKPIDKAKFKCLIGKRSRVVQIKISKALHQKNEELIDTMNELENQLFCERLNGKIETLNKNIGAITWITTAILAVTAAGLKFLWYVYQIGQLSYWKIEASAISIVDDKSLYYIFMLLMFALLMLGIMLIPYMIINSKAKILIKVVGMLIVFVASSYFVIKMSGLESIIKEYGFGGFIIAVILTFFVCVLFFLPGYLLGTAIDPRKTAKNPAPQKFGNTWIWLIVWMIIMTIYSYLTGAFEAESQTSFRITNEGYAIIFETNEYYYLAEYDKDKKEVNREHHIVVEKGNIEYFYNENE